MDNFTASGSGTPEFMFEYTDPSLQREVYSNMTSGVLELKLHEVYFADKFFGAKLARQIITCIQSVMSAVFVVCYLIFAAQNGNKPQDALPVSIYMSI